MTSAVKQLWQSQDPRVWQALHAQHDRAISCKHADAAKAKQLQELQKWYERLETDVQTRKPPHLTPEELVKLVEWKLSRDKWRPRLVQLAQSNTNKQQVKESTSQAVASLLKARDSKPAEQLQALGEAIDILADSKRKTKLKGVGPATTSALAAALGAGPYMSVALMDAAGSKADDYTKAVYIQVVKVLQQKVESLKVAAQKQGLSDLSWLTLQGLERCIFAASIVGGVEEAAQKLAGTDAKGSSNKDELAEQASESEDAAAPEAPSSRQLVEGRKGRKRTGVKLPPGPAKK